MAQDASKIHVGAGKIYIGVTPPATGDPPTMMPHTDGVIASGTEVGHTTGGSTFTYTPTKADIDSDQAFGVVDTYVTSESGELVFTIQERNYEALKLAFDNIGAVSDANKILLYGGGPYTVQSRTITLTSRQRVATTKFEVLTIYKAQSLNPVTLGYSRTDRSTMAIAVRAVHDTTRSNKDQLFQWYREL